MYVFLGEQSKKSHCFDARQRRVVHSSLCTHGKPHIRTRACRTDCTLIWRLVKIGKCSANTCGSRGIAVKKMRCTKVISEKWFLLTNKNVIAM